MGQDFSVPIKPITRLVLQANSSSQIGALSLRINSRNTQGRSKPEFSQNLDLGLSEGRWRNDVTSHFRHISSHSRFDVTLPGFEKVFLSTSKNVTTWYKCDDFVTSSHHFSGFGLEQNTVSKPGQVLGSEFQVFQFRLWTTLNEYPRLSLSGSNNLWVSFLTFPQQTKSIDG